MYGGEVEIFAMEAMFNIVVVVYQEPKGNGIYELLRYPDTVATDREVVTLLWRRGSVSEAGDHYDLLEIVAANDHSTPHQGSNSSARDAHPERPRTCQDTLVATGRSTTSVSLPARVASHSASSRVAEAAKDNKASQPARAKRNADTALGTTSAAASCAATAANAPGASVARAAGGKRAKRQPRPPRRRVRRRSRRSRRRKRASYKERTVQVSAKEYRHNAKISSSKRWREGQRTRKSALDAALRALPSLKTASFEVYCWAVHGHLAQAGFLFREHARMAYRNWRFKVARFKKQAMTKAAKKIVGDRDTSTVLVGFGNWSQQDGIKKERAPVKRLRQELRRRGVKVVSVDEFRTSKMCSRCCSSNRESEAKKVSFNGVECHQVVRCCNSECNVYWQRDVNASRNILLLLEHMVRGKERPEPLVRPARRVVT